MPGDQRSNPEGEPSLDKATRVLALYTGRAARARAHFLEFQIGENPSIAAPGYSEWEARKDEAYTDAQLAEALAQGVQLALEEAFPHPDGIGGWQAVVSAAIDEVAALGTFHDPGSQPRPPESPAI